MSCLSETWSIECAAWLRLPSKLLAVLHQAERTATAGRVAVAVLHQVGGCHDDDLVVLRWRDFADLLLGDHEEDRRVATLLATTLAEAEAGDPEALAWLRVCAPDRVKEGKGRR